MEAKLKEILEKTLMATKPLVDAASVADTKFLVTLLGMYRVSYTTLRDIYYLAENEGTGPSILDLTRKIIEHGISVEYMLMKGKEEMAERFQEYLLVQTHDELEFYRSIGQDPAAVSEELSINVQQADTDYDALSSDVKARKTWAGRSAEGMFEDLKTGNVLSDFDLSRSAQTYIWGSRLNHPNPMVVHSYLEPEESGLADSFYSRLGILMALSFHLRLTTRLIDESRFAVNENIYPEIAAEVAAIQQELNTPE